MKLMQSTMLQTALLLLAVCLLQQRCESALHGSYSKPCTHPFCTQMPPRIPNEALNNLQQDDPELIAYIREHLIGARPPQGTPYARPNLPLGLYAERIAYPPIEGQYGQAIFVENFFRALRDKGRLQHGFFLEAGAHDGYSGSNSLLFELKYNWTGLLVEPNRGSMHSCVAGDRNALTFPYCFSTTTTPEVVDFDFEGEYGGIINTADESKRRPGDLGRSGPLYKGRSTDVKSSKIQCFPLYSVLQAIGNPRIDYMTLDIEGAELQVLETLPFDKVDIQVLDIEVEHVGAVFPGTLKDLRKLMSENGYVMYQRIAGDEIFVKKALVEELEGAL